MTEGPLSPGCARYVPALLDPPETTAAGIRGLDWFSAAAVATWVACGLWPLAEIVSGRFIGRPAIIYVAAFLVYGVALIAILILPQRTVRPPRSVPVALAIVETLTAVALNLDTGWYLRGTGVGIGLLVIIAAQLPYFLSARVTWIWIIVQTVAMIWGIGGLAPGSAIAGVTFLTAAIGFQVFAAASSILAISEGRARTNLARTNAELTATRELLAESSRTEERLRISRDLHDTLGHHLAALSLQLDVASRLTEGQAADHISQAHAIAKLLLADVRDVVSTLRDNSRVDLAAAVRALAVEGAAMQIHLEIPATLAVDDASRAEAIVRAVQEIITNTARHAAARNLWVRLDASAAGVALHTRDDGRGAGSVAWGNGLRGMRERFEQHGGRVEVISGSGAGFEVRAFMPAAAAP